MLRPGQIQLQQDHLSDGNVFTCIRIYIRNRNNNGNLHCNEIMCSSHCTFTVTINESPVIGTCPSNVAQCDNHVVTWTDPTATGSPVTDSELFTASGSTFVTGTTTRNMHCNEFLRKSSCAFNVTINETPVISACPADITTCNPVVTYSTPGASGTPSATVSCLPASGSTFATGTTVVTCTATNLCGSSTCTFNVVVQTSSVAPADATSNAANNEICLGSNVTLTVAGGSLGVGADWTWYENGCGSGSPLGTGASITITPPTSGLHTYFVRAVGTCNTTTCVSISINVKTAPPAGTIHITSAPVEGCVGGTATISVNAVATATFYRWTCSSGGILFNGQPSPYDSPTPSVTITYTALPAAGASGWSICVFPGNACGNSNTICKWVRATISRPNPITGSVIGCANTSATYSCNNVGAASYIWSITGNATITNNGNQTITVNFGSGFTTGTLCVYAQTSCGYSSTSVCMNLSGVTAMPGTIAGNGNVCPNGSSTFTIAAVPGATSYIWTCSVPGSVVTNNGTSCSVLFPASVPAGSVCVSSVGPCGTPSATKCKGVASGLPSTPGPVSGPNSGQCGQTGVSYSISPVSGATGYLWTVNNGATISGPNNLSGVTVNFPVSFTSVNITVVASNVCGNSNVRTLAVSSIPGLPGPITGNTAVCNGGVEFYSTAGSAGATAYIWTVPANAQIFGGQNTANLVVLWGPTSGNVTVKSNNNCGNSGLRSLPVSIVCRQSQIQSKAEEINASVFPNPTSGYATVKFNSYVSEQLEINITDVTGRIMHSGNLQAAEGTNVHELDLSSFAKGVYMIQLKGREMNEILRSIAE